MKNNILNALKIQVGESQKANTADLSQYSNQY